MGSFLHHSSRPCKVYQSCIAASLCSRWADLRWSKRRLCKNLLYDFRFFCQDANSKVCETGYWRGSGRDNWDRVPSNSGNILRMATDSNQQGLSPVSFGNDRSCNSLQNIGYFSYDRFWRQCWCIWALNGDRRSVGCIYWGAFHLLGLFTWIDVTSVIIVSMVSFFGATAKTPISAIIMGSELTGGYALLAPMMLATFIAYIMSGQHNSIFRNQVLNRSDSPAHRMEYQRVILSDLYVKDVMKDPINRLPKDLSIEEALQILNRNSSRMIMVVNENDKLEGVVYKYKLFEFPEEYRKSIKLANIMIKDPFFAYTSDSLHHALVRLSSNDLQEMPVLSNENQKVIGIVTIADLVKLYDSQVEKILKARDPNNLGIGNNGNGNHTNKDNDIKDKTTN